MLTKIKMVEPWIGNTPTRKLAFELPYIELYAKLESENYTGSVKSRPAFNILCKEILRGKINQDTTIVESSSGNFAIALATLCKLLSLKFIPVIDPNINPVYEKKIRYLCDEVVKVEKEDETQGYLLTRLAKVKEMIEESPNMYWPNQYGNPLNPDAYYNKMSAEIIDACGYLDYIFVSVSSGGTITGLSQRLKLEFPEIKVIGVDIEGSVIFRDEPGKRYISGIGSSIVPLQLKNALIDEVLHVSHMEIIQGCNELVDKYMMFQGASSGAAYSAIKKYFMNSESKDGNKKVMFICPDKGDAYLDSIYDEKWIKSKFQKPIMA